METYHVIGMMSGTSVDGTDMAHCRFEYDGKEWRYDILHAETKGYSQEWKDRLNGVYSGTAAEFAKTHTDYGRYLGVLARSFMMAHGIGNVDCIASHGHTIFHRPAEKFTAQVGEGAALSAASGQVVACDFRTSDVAHGGQGAPLVPIGDRMLFPSYTHCLNLGGIANISFETGGSRLAYDIGPCNFLLNHVAGKAGMDYDKNGDLARSGKIVPGLLNVLSEAKYYSLAPPKSLGREDMEQVFLPLVEKSGAAYADILCTLCEHLALKVAEAVPSPRSRMLLSGGGAWNAFLVERIRARVAGESIVPDARTVDFKEALIFAFLGVLRLRGEANCLASVTGADRDACGGALYRP